jgi:hypothetical protein
VTGATALCYEGPDGTQGVGACADGIRTCADGAWGECAGQTTPAAETCDGLDDDCDGAVDEDVLSACGDCDAACEIVAYGAEAGARPLDAAETRLDGVALDASGAVVLGGVRASRPVLWTAGTLSTVARIDTTGLEETARYRAGAAGTSESPVAVAVDYDGNAYVANSGSGRSASATKISYDCPDVDRDGEVETSGARVDVRDWGTDECVAWNEAVGCGIGGACGAAGAIAYEMRVQDEIAERVWFGLVDEEKFVELDARTGEATGEEANCRPCRTTGAAVDRDGTLWATCGPGVCRFATDDPDAVEVLYHPPFNEGVAIDSGGRIFFGGQVSVDDPAGVWTPYPDVVAHGVAVAPDGAAFFGACPGGDATDTACRVDPITLELATVSADLRILAFDSDGMLWGFSPGAWIYDPATDVATPVLRDCDGPDTYCVTGPALESDMTGEGLLLSTDPPGTWSAVVQGCPAGETEWLRLDWDADTAASRAVRFEVRAANDTESLAARRWTVLAAPPPADLGAALGIDRTAPLLELRATLAADATGDTPTLDAVHIERDCR